MRITIEFNEGERLWYADTVDQGIRDMREHGKRPAEALSKLLKLAAHNGIEVEGGRKLQLTPDDISRIDIDGAKQTIDRLRNVVDSLGFKDPHDTPAWQQVFGECADLMNQVAGQLRLEGP